MVKVKQQAIRNDSAHSLHPKKHEFVAKWIGLELIYPQRFMQAKIICASAHEKNERDRVQNNKL